MHHHRLAPWVFLVVGLAACGDRTPQAIAVPVGDLSKSGALTVTGTATLEVSPDIADLTMTIMAEGARPGAAASGVRAKQQELVEALAKIGIENGDLKLSHLRLDPVYADRASGWTSDRITGYRAQITVAATTTKFDQLDAVMEAGANAGASSMSSNFRRSNLPELKKQVRDMAIQAAKDKAAQTAKALGIEVGAVVNVFEGTNAGGWNSNANFMANESAVRTTGGGLGGTLQSITLDVTVAFELAKRV